jgi:hypothetical protein
MHSAPTVKYPVGRLHFQVALSLALLLGAGAVVTWYLQADHPGWRQGLAMCVWLLCAALALRDESQPAKGVLRWDGQHWIWESDLAVLAGTVVPRADWQIGVLLEFRAPGHRVHWLWLERGETGNWNALRRALWAPGTTTPLQPTHTAGVP